MFPADETSLKMTSGSIDEKDEAASQQLCELAQEITQGLARVKDGQRVPPALQEKQQELQKCIKQGLLQKNDEILYDGLEHVRFESGAAYQLLKLAIEDAAEAVIIRRGERGSFEINAFMIPLFVKSTGGLKFDQDFQDQEAFDQLTASIQQHQLESKNAKVVLISHAYHLEEIDGITYCHLNDMIRDAAAALSDKRGAAIPAIERSFTGWPVPQFAAGDEAVELRFLLGFSMKKIDDVFYQVPDEESAADLWFERRAERFRSWSVAVAPLVRRCLANDGRTLDINFLYQDGFHGAKQTGLDEYHMLEMMADLSAQLQEKNLAPSGLSAKFSAIEQDGEPVLQVSVFDAGDAPVASAQKPLETGRDLQAEYDDVADALDTMGIRVTG